MKLLHCLDCGDIRRLNELQGDWAYCDCKSSAGRYTDDIHAEVKGEWAALIGFGNNSFFSAKVHWSGSKHTEGKEFTAFFIPDTSHNVTRIEE